MRLIGFCGISSSGKDTAAEHLIKCFDFTRIALADPIKRACHEWFGFDEAQLWGDKRNVPDKRWPVRCAGCQSCEFRRDHAIGFLTPRHALQQLGTEFGRKCSEDVWVKYLIRTAEKLCASGGELVYDKTKGLVHRLTLCRSVEEVDLITASPPEMNGVVVSDIRYKNEIRAIREAGGKVIKLSRKVESLLQHDLASHSSEQVDRIPDSYFDAFLSNDGTIPDLWKVINPFMKAWWPDLLRDPMPDECKACWAIDVTDANYHFIHTCERDPRKKTSP